jgi:hypothetical protein
MLVQCQSLITPQLPATFHCTTQENIITQVKDKKTDAAKEFLGS